MDQLEQRILVGDLLARCMDAGLTRREVMMIVVGDGGKIGDLLDIVANSSAVEARVRHLREIITIASSICGVETEAWLRSSNVAFGQQSPIETLLVFPDALAGMMHLMRRIDEGCDRIH